MTLSLRKPASVDVALRDLHVGSPGISPVWGAAIAEAASVCFDERGHSDPAAMQLDGALSAPASVHWQKPNDQALRCWNDDEVATEHGAYAIAALLVPVLCGLHIILRARKGKGFDFWLGSTEDPGPLFQDKARLEVSGIREGSDSDVAARVKAKKTQIDRSKGLLPGIIVVVEFTAPRSRIVLR